ncbi:hypothetical protein SADUNF_Sadunf06G0025600 [Salix dunnii]|uniref:Uncharacterized protein n=1 Tax=Salix dunnii TaxID=1413687 RepID=A0A835K531_9ROSI|nr:hypothetical protein SADUNF_Sadunf06G0025600 [Salix dunnii]
MPHRTRPMTALLVFTGVNVILVSTITPVYDFVCFLPYWERRRERRRQERQADAITKAVSHDNASVTGTISDINVNWKSLEI